MEYKQEQLWWTTAELEQMRFTGTPPEKISVTKGYMTPGTYRVMCGKLYRIIFKNFNAGTDPGGAEKHSSTQTTGETRV